MRTRLLLLGICGASLLLPPRPAAAWQNSYPQQAPSPDENGAEQEPQPSKPDVDSATQRELDRTHTAQIHRAGDIAAAWLVLIDQGKYKDAWTQFALITRHETSEKSWEYQIKHTKENYGRFLSRHETEIHYATDLPNAPPGKYVVAQYQVHFEHKPQANETVVVQKTPGGTWQVAGYFLQ